MSYPDNYKYSSEHEWISPDGTVGITEYAAEQVGDIVFVDLPKVGDSVTAGQSFGVIESVKAVSELFAPVSGAVTAVNDALTDAPETISSDPHGAGWLIKVEPGDASQLGGLMDAAAYESMIAGG
ncbi:MAG TPA: glycine cleavage system protein GcvH [Gemmatimonadales bacterium]|nr:glycine cleavage system protein GcvH [Gemmatimonadales bacterium]